MIAVSDSFKKAIKSDNREIYGYVDVIYDKKDGEYEVTQIPTISPLSKQDGSDLIDGITHIKNYATLENNYFSLDGSFILANKNTLGESGGYISNDVYSDISNRIITLVSSESGYVTTQGFTIFFKDNIPFDFDIIITTDYAENEEDEDETVTINVRNNTNRNYQKIFEENITIRKLELIIYNVEYNDRRLRISDIYLSLANVYEGEELVKFEVNEEIDLLTESVPIDTCVVNINNYPDENGYYKFDPINPYGIVSYLTENSIVQPYIGVLTDENGIEYVKMGTFYINDWSSDINGNVTINCQNIFGKIQDKEIISDGNLISDSNWKNKDYMNNIFTKSLNHPVSINYGSMILNGMRYTNCFDILKTAVLQICKKDNGSYYRKVFKNNRNNIISLDFKDNTIDDIILRNNLYNDAKMVTKKTIGSVICKDQTLSPASSTEGEILNVDYKLVSTEQYVWFEFSKKGLSTGSFNYSVISGNANATLIDCNNYLCYVKIVGTIDSVIHITYTSYMFEDGKEYDIEYIYDKNGDVLNINTLGYIGVPLSYTYYDYILKNDKKYIVTAKTIGDPSIETGDIVSIETRYNTSQNIIVTKQKFTYDGGLQCDMEGRGN